MVTRYGKFIILSIMVLSFVVPAALMFWNPQLGMALLLPGIFIAVHCIRLMQTAHLHSSLHPGNQQAPAQRDHARTVFVQLTDEHGNDLPRHEAQARLAAAQRQAGPCELVIGVRHKL